MPVPLFSYRRATPADAALLAVFNHQLIQDEGHRSTMTVAQLEQRMCEWLASGAYTALLLTNDAGVAVAYALLREDVEEVYLRHLFVARGHRRRGWGRAVLDLVRGEFLPAGKRLMVVALCANAPALAFWRASGFADYSLTLEWIPPPGATD